MLQSMPVDTGEKCSISRCTFSVPCRVHLLRSKGEARIPLPQPVRVPVIVAHASRLRRPQQLRAKQRPAFHDSEITSGFSYLLTMCIEDIVHLGWCTMTLL